MTRLRIVGRPDDKKLTCKKCGSPLFLGTSEAFAYLGEQVGDLQFGDAGEAVAWLTTCPKCRREYLVTAPEPR